MVKAKAVLPFLVSFSFASSAFGKEIKETSPEYSDPKNWKVGDTVENFGTVVKKEIAGPKVKIWFDLNGDKVTMEVSVK